MCLLGQIDLSRRVYDDEQDIIILDHRIEVIIIYRFYATLSFHSYVT